MTSTRDVSYDKYTAGPFHQQGWVKGCCAVLVQIMLFKVLLLNCRMKFLKLNVQVPAHHIYKHLAVCGVLVKTCSSVRVNLQHLKIVGNKLAKSIGTNPALWLLTKENKNLNYLTTVIWFCTVCRHESATQSLVWQGSIYSSYSLWNPFKFFKFSIY